MSSTKSSAPDRAVIPAGVERYVETVTAVLRQILGDELVGIYPTGSLALGGFTPGRSDIDLMAVVDDGLSRPAGQRLLSQLDGNVLPVPATGLELVLYPRATVTADVVTAGYSLNLNMGPELPRRASLDPADDPAFWYGIDRAITYQSGWPLFGPPPRALFHPLPFPTLLAVLVSAVEAQARPGAGHLLDNATLNGCRTLRFALTGRWHTKQAAAAWFAVRFPQVQPVVSAAASSYEHGRAAGNRLIAEEVHEPLDFVLERLLAMQAAGVSQTRARRAPDDLGLSRPFSDDLGLSPPR